MTNTVDRLKELTDNLNFRSETDRLCHVFAPTIRRQGAVDVAAMERATGRKFNEPTPQDHYTFDSFMAKHTRPEVQPAAKRYAELRDGMIELLTARQVFRMTGNPKEYYNVTYYVVGIDAQEGLFGVEIQATET